MLFRSGISDAETALCYAAEREALAQMSADCSETAAAWCRILREEESRNGVSAETPYGADRLVLDVMYADRRVRMTGLVSEAEGIRLARCAAQKVKCRQEKAACGATDNGTEK